ncbi:MAG TPA: PspA/IM30 family protein, partial [Anaerolineae bacterium]|nr:PspA/IM30 family protein [Anaerolineae bacterium]
ARLKAIFGARVNQALDELEDPQASLDYSLTRLQASLRQISDSLVETAAARRRLETQRIQLEKAIAKYEGQARDALAADREDLARRALERKAAGRERLDGLNANIATLEAQVESLKTSQATLRHKIELFQGKKEELKALYDSSRAQLQVKEAVSGISRDLADVGHAIERAETRIQAMQARVEAIDELVAVGALEDALEPGDDIDRELARISRQTAVEQDLARLKAEASASASSGAEGLDEVSAEALAVGEA